MIVVQPPDPPAAGASPASLSISRIARHAFDPGPVSAADPELDRFLADLLAPYGRAPAPYPAEQTYAAMVEALLRSSGALDTRVDLVVLAHAVPDADPRRSAAHVVHHLCPGNPLVFALSDQGVAAPFSALATAGAYLRTGGFERALVLILEQATLPYQAPEPVTLPEQGSAVALLLERSDSRPVVSLNQRRAVAASRVAEALATMTEAMSPESVVVLGAGLAGHLDRARVAAPGRLCTAVWWELAQVCDDAQDVLVAEYDPALGSLCVLALGPRISERRAATTS
jgi:hypothetical protein